MITLFAVGLIILFIPLFLSFMNEKDAQWESIKKYLGDEGLTVWDLYSTYR